MDIFKMKEELAEMSGSILEIAECLLPEYAEQKRILAETDLHIAEVAKGLDEYMESLVKLRK